MIIPSPRGANRWRGGWSGGIRPHGWSHGAHYSIDPAPVATDAGVRVGLPGRTSLGHENKAIHALQRSPTHQNTTPVSLK